MHLMRIGPVGSEKPVARLTDETYVDLSETIHDFDETFFSSGGLRTLPAIIAAQVASDATSRFAGERVGAPIARPHQILCVGLNYRDHAAETGQEIPREPILFTKSPNTIIGPNDEVRIPSLASSSASARAILTRSRMRRIRSPATASSTT
jgi:2-keto-4-pentenoate hydratase/2-oxohepta-3-ene-1,7-dioic acid hydratase in catechol pathway